MKKIILIVSLINVLSFFTSCSAGYVASQPTYVETERPMKMYPSYIWVDGGWRWDNQSKSYYHQNGRWDRPRTRAYNQGHWNNSSRGYKWIR